MHINKASTEVQLKLRNPKRIMENIPTAQLSGKYDVVLPFGIDEARQLTKLGITVPSPIEHHYKWPGRYTPFKAQRITAAFITLHKRAFVLNDLGTGKTLAVLWAYDYLKSLGKVNSMLVAAPLSTLERAWADEIFRNFPHLTFTVLHGTREKRHRLLQEHADIYIINHDGVHICEELLNKRADIDLIVVDEIALAARNGTTRRWKALNKVINNAKIPRMAWGMTGTPTPNQPTDAWAQVKLIRPANVPFVFSRFRNMVMMQQGPFLWVPRRNAISAVKEIMQPAIRFSRDECVDLPPCMYESKDVELTPDQSKAYRSMMSTLMIEAEEGKILAVNEAVKTNKLVQIACGVVYTAKGDEVTIDPSKRLATLVETIEQTQYKIIVFVPFVSTVRLVSEHLRSKGYTIGVIYGAIKPNERNQIFQAFQNDDDPRILVAQPAAMAHGLTLTQANMIVWYAPITSNDIYTQANGRITRPGQLNKQFVIHLQATPVERKIFTRLKNKQSMQGVLLDSVQAARK